MTLTVAPRLHFLGVGDATCGDGPNVSVLYTGNLKLLVDCGPTVPQAFFRVLSDTNVLDAIWITHQHADHCFGLPTLLLGMRLAGRTKPLELLGGSGSATFLRQLLELGYPGSFRSRKCFPIAFTEVTPENSLERAGLRLTTARPRHRVTCHAIRVDEGPYSVCVSGDGKITAETLALYRDADLVVHECEWATRTSDEHSNVGDLRSLLDGAHASRVALVHCNAFERDEIAELANHLLGGRAWLARAGEVTTIKPKPTPRMPGA